MLLSSRSHVFLPRHFYLSMRRLKLAGNVTSIKMEYSWGRGRILSVVEKLKICKGNRKPGKDRGKTEWSHRTCERIFLLYLQGRWDSTELCNHGILFDVGIIIGRKLRGEFENSLHNNNIPIKRVNVSSDGSNKISFLFCSRNYIES